MLYYGNWVMTNLNLDQFSPPRSLYLLYRVFVLQKYTMCQPSKCHSIISPYKANSYMKNPQSTITGFAQA